MAPPRIRKIVAGTVAATVALTAGVAIAGDGEAPSDVPKLDDVVFVRDVVAQDVTTTTVTMPDDGDSMQSPFDTVMSVESMESPDSPESVESVESPESMESPDSPESVESADSADSADSP